MRVIAGAEVTTTTTREKTKKKKKKREKSTGENDRDRISVSKKLVKCEKEKNFFSRPFARLYIQLSRKGCCEKKKKKRESGACNHFGECERFQIPSGWYRDISFSLLTLFSYFFFFFSLYSSISLTTLVFLFLVKFI